jgi:RimJ/RimL family protein N-acetyltransferase
VAAAARAAAATASGSDRAGEGWLGGSAMHREGGELLQDVPGTALGTGHRLLHSANELVEMRLAFHARVLVDRHAPSVLSRAVDRWAGTVLEGRIVRLEPLSPEHEEGLWLASRDERTWRWLSVVQPETREEWSAWMRHALAAAETGTEIPFVTMTHGRIVGSTRFLALKPEHRSLEIGWTWLEPTAWGTGANVEAKLLQLEYAFDSLGCRRVEFKTDALNERARAALAALGAAFEGIHRKHMLVRGGESRDSAWYSILDEEWPAARAHLERRLVVM